MARFVMTTHTDAPSRSHRFVLRVLFVPALAWTLLLLAGERADWPERLVPVPEGHPLHEPLELCLVLAAALAASGLASAALFLLLPGFLRVPRPVPAWRPLWWLAAGAPLLFAVLTAFFFLACRLLVVPGEDPGNPQRGLSAWMAALFYPAALTPPGAVIAAWVAARRAGRRR